MGAAMSVFRLATSFFRLVFSLARARYITCNSQPFKITCCAHYHAILEVKYLIQCNKPLKKGLKALTPKLAKI
jgi:hypothetical protein